MSPDATPSNVGSVDTSKTVKAGCGIRYDPEEMSEESGFDFTAAEAFKESLVMDDHPPSTVIKEPNQPK